MILELDRFTAAVQEDQQLRAALGDPQTGARMEAFMAADGQTRAVELGGFPIDAG